MGVDVLEERVDVGFLVQQILMPDLKLKLVPFDADPMVTWTKAT